MGKEHKSYSNQIPHPFPRGDNDDKVKRHRQLIKQISFSKTAWSTFQPNLAPSMVIQDSSDSNPRFNDLMLAE